MTTILSQANRHFLKDLSTETLSNIKTLVPVMVFTGTVIGTIHAGLTWTNICKFEGTPFTSALYFGLMPAVQKATGAIFKSFIPNDPSRKIEQIKAQQMITTTCAAFCTPVITTIVYNFFAHTLNGLNNQECYPPYFLPKDCNFHQTWNISTVLSQQLYGTVHLPALLCGMGIMANKAVKTVLKAQGFSEAEIEFQMSNASNDLKSKDDPLALLPTESEEIISTQSIATEVQIKKENGNR
ncbi:MAG: hypothetical protein H0X29_08880 [Parachlamydiaceae bacterium]|nr:hypothetical protein [Parachlamydiaceae bacterium]